MEVDLKKALNGDPVLREMIENLVKTNGIKTIIETGTQFGYSASFFATIAEKVITTEINEKRYKLAKEYLSNWNNVEVFLGDSAVVLKKVLKQFAKDRKVFFFLDAHNQNDLALDRELEEISNSNVIPYIAIHDFQVPTRKDLGSDKWDGKRYNYKNLKNQIDPLYKNGYKHYYNEKSIARRRGRQRGCIFIEPI